MQGCTVYSSQSTECSRLSKWEGVSVYKILTVTRTYVQIYPRRQFGSASAFPFNSAVQWVLSTAWGNARFLAKHISWLEAISTCSTVKMVLDGNQLSYRKIPLNFCSKVNCRECFPCFLLVLKSGLRLLQNAVFSVTCVRCQWSSQACLLATRISAGLCVSAKAKVTFLGPNGYFRG